MIPPRQAAGEGRAGWAGPPQRPPARPCRLVAANLPFLALGASGTSFSGGGEVRCALSLEAA